MITVKDVAQRAGVSSGVVSYVLNNSNYVSMEKREAVLNAIDELGYQPNYLAKSLKTNKTNHIAIVSDNFRSEFFGELLYHFDELAFKEGRIISLFGSRHTKLTELGQYRLEGVFLFTSQYSVEMLNQLAATGTKVVLANNMKYDGLDKMITQIDLGMYNSMKELIHHAISLGHTRIAFFSPTIMNSVRETNFRMKGYTDAMNDNGIAINPDFIEYGSPDFNEVLAKLDALMSLAPDQRPTAIMAGNSSSALKLMGYLKNKGINVPEDISIASCDGITLAGFSSPTLTSIDLNIDRIAEKVMDCIIRSKRSTQKILIQSSIIIRDSLVDIG